MGKFGIIVCKDFTSVLSEGSDTRSGVFAALREIYDGKWVRRLGSEGGRTLAWTGQAGLIAAVTETIDRHSEAMGAMGERFVFYRMPALGDEGRLAQGRVAGHNTGRQAAIRRLLAMAGAEFIEGLEIPTAPEPLSPEALEALVFLSDLATRCRSAVERDGFHKEVELVPQSEALGRMQAVLTQLVRGLWLIGLDDNEVQRLIRTVALDSMPKHRRSVVELIANSDLGVRYSAAAAADKLGLPTAAVDRTLVDLAAHGIVDRYSGRPHQWGPSEWLQDRWSIALPSSVHGPVDNEPDPGHLETRPGRAS
jgi:hypothetical protein